MRHCTKPFIIYFSETCFVFLLEVFKNVSKNKLVIIRIQYIKKFIKLWEHINTAIVLIKSSTSFRRKYLNFRKENISLIKGGARHLFLHKACIKFKK